MDFLGIERQIDFIHHMKQRELIKEHNIFLSDLKDELCHAYADYSMCRSVNAMYIKENPPPKERTFMFLTVSPKTDVTLETLKERVDKLVKRPFMSCVRYSYEQTGTDEDSMGYHPHCHFVFSKTKGYSPSQLTSRIASTFKGLGNAKMINLKEYPESYRTEKILYLQGVKWDPEKESACQLNKKWRALNALKDIY